MEEDNQRLQAEYDKTKKQLQELHEKHVKVRIVRSEFLLLQCIECNQTFVHKRGSNLSLPP